MSFSRFVILFSATPIIMTSLPERVCAGSKTALIVMETPEMLYPATKITPATRTIGVAKTKCDTYCFDENVETHPSESTPGG